MLSCELLDRAGITMDAGELAQRPKNMTTKHDLSENGVNTV
jgi:hypothetical protein